MDSNRLRNLKVGVAAIVSCLLLGFSYWYVGSLRLASGSYLLKAIFPSAQGLDTGTPVMIAGVRIGDVAGVSLTRSNKAQVELRINGEVVIPKGSRVRLASRSVLGDPFVEIVPGPPGQQRMADGQTLPGQPQVTLDDLLPKVASVLERLDKVGASADRLLSDQALQQNLTSAAVNLRLASVAGLGLITDMRGVASENRDELNRTTSSLAGAMENLQVATQHIEEFLSGTGSGDLRVIVANLKQASADIGNAADNAKKITDMPGMPGMKQDLEQSIRNLRETTEGAKAIVERVSKVVGVGPQASGAEERPQPPPVPSGKGPKVDFLFDSDRGKFRTDINYTHQLRSGDFLRVGGYDLGEDTKLNLQAGRILKPGHAFRGGLYQSRLGIGYDWQASDKWMLQGDLYRPNAPRVDVKGLIDLTPGYGGWLGFEDIGGSNRAVAGVQFKF